MRAGRTPEVTRSELEPEVSRGRSSLASNATGSRPADANCESAGTGKQESFHVRQSTRYSGSRRFERGSELWLTGWPRRRGGLAPLWRHYGASPRLKPALAPPGPPRWPLGRSLALSLSRWAAVPGRGRLMRRVRATTAYPRIGGPRRKPDLLLCHRIVDTVFFHGWKAQIRRCCATHSSNAKCVVWRSAPLPRGGAGVFCVPRCRGA